MAYLEMAVDDSSATQLGETFFEGEGFTRAREGVRITRNIRSVGLISKPGRTQELKQRLEGPVLDHLRAVPGFGGAMILHTQKESRNLWVLTFWDAEDRAAATRWEESPGVRALLSPLIDVCMKVQTFEATFPEGSGATRGRPLSEAASVC